MSWSVRIATLSKGGGAIPTFLFTFDDVNGTEYLLTFDDPDGIEYLLIGAVQ